MKLFGGKNNKENGGKKPPRIGRRQLISNILTVIIIFLFISSAYSLLSGFGTKTDEVTLSEVAKRVEAGEVRKITVEGERLTVLLKNGTSLQSKKEREASFTDTLKNYGVSPDTLAQTE